MRGTPGAVIFAFIVLALVACNDAAGSGLGTGGSPSGGVAGYSGTGGMSIGGNGGSVVGPCRAPGGRPSGASVQAGPLTPDQVAGLAPGNAQGSGYGGLYIEDGAGATDCTCRSGSCAEFTADNLFIASVTQQDGTLTMDRVRGYVREGVCSGGVDANGCLWCGVTSGDNLLLIEGQFSPEGVIPPSFSMTLKETARDISVEARVDCNVLQSGTFKLFR